MRPPVVDICSDGSPIYLQPTPEDIYTLPYRYYNMDDVSSDRVPINHTRRRDQLEEIYLDFSLFEDYDIEDILLNTNTSFYPRRRQYEEEELNYEQYVNLTEVPTPAKNKEQLPIMEVKGEKTNDQCTICLSNYEEGESVKVLPCYHTFHWGCIDRWLESKNKCPICKQDVD